MESMVCGHSWVPHFKDTDKLENIQRGQGLESSLEATLKKSEEHRRSRVESICFGYCQILKVYLGERRQIMLVLWPSLPQIRTEGWKVKCQEDILFWCH